MEEARVLPVMEQSSQNAVIPYQFEPVQVDSGSNSDHSSWDTVEEDSDIEYELAKERSQENAEDWCTCGSCQRMQTSLECLCCKEISETKLLLSKENIGS